ncbi:MAG TPA: LTA synthase family protein [Gemmatimonadales bacterium]|jgi:phosphoglycerol transferase MdoB-like AlkP superfamily enzyme|nr:LTA synthase family protein [Gemmatimonadales bacterium]
MPARLKFLALYLGYWVLLFACLRAIFLGAFASQAMALSLGTLLGTFANGLRLDLSAAAYLSLLPCLLLVLATLPRAGCWPLKLVLPYTAVAATVLGLLACADLGVFDGWGQHIDAGVLGYLPNPREAWASAAIEPRGLLLALWLAVSLGFLQLARRLLAPRLRALPPLGFPAAGPLLLSAAALVIPARGGLQLIPINQSSAYFSPQRFANQAALNVGWNFFDTWRRGLDRRGNPYLAMPMDSARALVAGTRLRPERGEAAPRPRLLTTLRPNILLIVWESFTARAVERLGGVPAVTPEFAALARQGLLFRRFYAAGDHTEKGLAALLSGAPSLPNASILRVPSKAASLPMLSQDLAAAGYHTGFYYGGELGFGNLRSFTLEGRFEQVLGKDDFPRSSWSSKWGVHDQVVADRLLKDLSSLQAPFFVTWLTLSSHEPFEVPGPARVPGRDPEARFLNSLAYTDQVVGSLLHRAAAEPWWANTLVIVVADHSKLLERTYAGAPFKSSESWFHIPMLWTGGALALHGESAALGGQTDLAPTLLRALGLPGAGRYRFGRDLFAGTGAPFAFYGFEEGFGLVTERGSLVWERAPARVTASSGAPGADEIALGRALLQLAYQDYLDR